MENAGRARGRESLANELRTPQERPSGELLYVWGLLALVVLAVLVTYSRLAPEETYHVSRDGLAGGASRALVVRNFPIALAAIGVVGAARARRASVARRSGDRALCRHRLARARRPGRSRRSARQRRPRARGRARRGADGVGAAARLARAAAAVRPGAGRDRGRCPARLGALAPRRGRLLRTRSCARRRGSARRGDRGRAPRPPPRDGRRAADARRPAPLAGRPLGAPPGVPRADARLRAGERAPGLLARAGRQARHDGRHFLRGPPSVLVPSVSAGWGAPARRTTAPAALFVPLARPGSP